MQKKSPTTRRKRMHDLHMVGDTTFATEGRSKAWLQRSNTEAVLLHTLHGGIRSGWLALYTFLSAQHAPGARTAGLLAIPHLLAVDPDLADAVAGLYGLLEGGGV